MSKQAILFAGQGAQFVGMGQDLATAYPACKALFDKADDVLGYSLSGICFDGPAEELTKTNHCQPGIFVASIACYTALKVEKPELEFAAAAGLSLGEWSALHMAGALTFEDTLKVLEARGRFMQEACDATEGGMLSVIGLDFAQLEAICAETGVSIANLNSPEQTVLSGLKSGIAAAEVAAKAAGAKRAIVLPVAGAYHSELMASAAPKLAAVLESVEIATPRIPVISNVTGQAHGSAAEIREAMFKQVTNSVHWYEGIAAIKAVGVTKCLECGPGKVLSGLMRRLDREMGMANIQDAATLAAFVEKS
jgi:[acyl-carrier-protein] S-malonyltransferase